MQRSLKTPVDEETYDQFPALRARLNRRVDHRIDEARRVLWRAFQHGTLSEEELARTLDRLEFDPGQHARLNADDRAN